MSMYGASNQGGTWEQERCAFFAAATGDREFHGTHYSYGGPVQRPLQATVPAILQVTAEMDRLMDRVFSVVDRRHNQRRKHYAKQVKLARQVEGFKAKLKGAEAEIKAQKERKTGDEAVADVIDKVMDRVWKRVENHNEQREISLAIKKAKQQKAAAQREEDQALEKALKAAKAAEKKEAKKLQQEPSKVARLAKLEEKSGTEAAAQTLVKMRGLNFKKRYKFLRETAETYLEKEIVIFVKMIETRDVSEYANEADPCLSLVKDLCEEIGKRLFNQLKLLRNGLFARKERKRVDLTKIANEFGKTYPKQFEVAIRNYRREYCEAGHFNVASWVDNKLRGQGVLAERREFFIEKMSVMVRKYCDLQYPNFVCMAQEFSALIFKMQKVIEQVADLEVQKAQQKFDQSYLDWAQSKLDESMEVSFPDFARLLENRKVDHLPDEIQRFKAKFLLDFKASLLKQVKKEFKPQDVEGVMQKIVVMLREIDFTAKIANVIQENRRRFVEELDRECLIKEVVANQEVNEHLLENLAKILDRICTLFVGISDGVETELHYGNSTEMIVRFKDLVAKIFKGELPAPE